jgi:phage terminase small subunit
MEPKSSTPLFFFWGGGEGEWSFRPTLRKGGSGLAPLKGMREAFAMEYIVDYNATKAAIRAGYSEDSAASEGSRLLKNAKVAARVRELQEQFNKERCFGDKERVLKELWETYEKATQAVPVMVWDSAKHSYVESGEFSFDGKTATKAMELIGKMSGMFTEKVNIGANAESNGEVRFCIEVKKTGNSLGTE